MDFEKIDNFVDYIFQYKNRKDELMKLPSTTNISNDKQLEVLAYNIANCIKQIKLKKVIVKK